MAYLCPVCEEPQVDAGHLANHVAFTAVIRGGAHENWLDEHVPGWGENDEDKLAERLLDLDSVEATDHPIDASDDQDGGHGHQHEPAVGRGPVRDSGGLDADAQRILDDAQELTRQMQASDGDTDADNPEGETE